MDQQQAVEFTQKALTRGATPEQVAYVLAERMNAPVEVIYRFVQRVAAQKVPTPPAIEPEAQYHSSPVDEYVPETEEEVEEPATLVQEVPVAFSAPPPPPPAEDDPMDQAFDLRAADEATIIAQQVEDVTVLAEAPETDATEQTPQEPAVELPTRGKMAALYQNQAVHDQVLKQLKRHQNPSDIAYKLSEQYGVRWHDAERFVSEIATRNQSQLQGKTNFLLLFFSVVCLIAGLALLVTGLLSLMEGFFGQPSDRMSQTVGTLIGGGLLTLGGAVGLYITIRPPRD